MIEIVHFIYLVMRNAPFYFLKYLNNIICGHVREVMSFFIPVGTNYALLQTCIYFVIRDTSGCVFLTINKQMAAKDKKKIENL